MIGDAILRCARACDVSLGELITTDEHAQVDSARFSKDNLYASLHNERVERLYVGTRSRGAFECSFYLRPLEPNASESRSCDARVLIAGTENADSLRVLVAEVVHAYSVAQGMIAAFASTEHALVETERGIVQKNVDQETRGRQWNDLTEDVFFGTKLRRLYPVTIIGKAIWESLPPLPVLERPPEIRDLGDCKMLIAWPELCSPHDPEFLAGTRELRQWLWPHTIQNPYDKLDLDV
jgi:hypothetical protein